MKKKKQSKIKTVKIEKLLQTYIFILNITK